MRDRRHVDAMAETFQADPIYAAVLFVEVVVDGDSAELAILLSQFAAMEERRVEENSSARGL